MSVTKIPLSKIGEFGLIDQISRLIKVDKRRVIKGIGDDASVLTIPSGSKYLLLTTDMLAEDAHFTKAMGAKRIGRKALACGISDIAAMGGMPKAAVVSLAVPPRLSVDFVKDMYQGMQTLAGQFQVSIVGGDTIAYKEIIINVALLGEVEKKYFVLRSGTRKGDRIFVTGSLGRSLKTGKHLSFIPRIEEARFLVRNFKPTSMMDISDGLAGDLNHILKSSGVGANIYTERIPRRKGVTLKEALYDGEDFELLFTLSEKNAYRLARFNNQPFRFICIGEVVGKKNGIKLIDHRGQMNSLKTKAFTHF